MPGDPQSRESKIAKVTLLFWVIKLCATILGETGGDLLSKTCELGYLVSTLIFFGFFAVMVTLQLATRRYHPFLYWAVILSTLTAGTTLSDFMDRTLGLGYTLGAAILFTTLLVVLGVWWWTERSLSVDNIRTRRAEVFYWLAILVSNTLGTAAGDYMADDLELGFKTSALVVGGLLAVVAGLAVFTKLSRVALFWIAFILTRPFGATLGDVLARGPEEGGLGWGTLRPSLVLLGVCVVVIAWTAWQDRKRTASGIQAST